ncbi:MAG: class I SAM-dependent methyltransferase, partial [Solirubrobacterales bacterium]|nr:class I SAM-dependent methyltransferase [Solirubrobacterales bacterium]
SSSRKCAFLARAVEVCGVANAEVVHARAESFPAARSGYDVVTARAVGPLAVTAEYAAPLLRVGGCLVVWQGRRDPDADRALAQAAGELGFGEAEIRRVLPYQTAANRHLYLLTKVRQTPDRFPRRPGMALKRPLGRP